MFSSSLLLNVTLLMSSNKMRLVRLKIYLIRKIFFQKLSKASVLLFASLQPWLSRQKSLFYFKYVIYYDLKKSYTFVNMYLYNIPISDIWVKQPARITMMVIRSRIKKTWYHHVYHWRILTYESDNISRSFQGTCMCKFSAYITWILSKLTSYKIDQ